MLMGAYCCVHTLIYPKAHTHIYTQTPHPTTNQFHIQVKAKDMAARATARGRTAESREHDHHL